MNSISRAAVSPVRLRRIQIEAAELKYFVAHQVRGQQREVCAGGLPRRQYRVAPVVENPTDIGLLPETLPASQNRELLCGPILICTRPALQAAEIVVAGLPCQLC